MRGCAWTNAVALSAAAAAVFVLTLQAPAIRQALRRSASDVLALSARGDPGLPLRKPEPAPEPIAFNYIVRTAATAGRRLLLGDGSEVEMGARTELRVERGDDGLAVRLHSGRVIVRAAAQRGGHLYVKTKQMTVAGAAAVFLVQAEDAGTTVGVIAGEVGVRGSAGETRLRSGEQEVTSPFLGRQSLRDALAWSRNADAYLGALRVRE